MLNCEHYAVARDILTRSRFMRNSGGGDVGFVVTFLVHLDRWASVTTHKTNRKCANASFFPLNSFHVLNHSVRMLEISEDPVPNRLFPSSRDYGIDVVRT